VKRLAEKLEQWRPLFESGGRLARLKPVFDAADSLLFSVPVATVNAPHVRDPLDVKRFMTIVIVALIPAVVGAWYFFGLRVLAMIAVSYVVGGLLEVAVAVVRREPINEGFLVTGLLFPLTLPPGLPLWMVGVGVAFGVFVGKEMFGGTGRNLFNPALVGRCFLTLGYPRAMSSGWITPGHGTFGRLFEYADAVSVQALSSATPLTAARRGVLVSFRELFWGVNRSGCAGETCAPLLLVGGVLLLLTGIASWRTVMAVVGAYTATALTLCVVVPDACTIPLRYMLAGGFVLGAFFMATDPVTSPNTNEGKWFYGVLIGAVTVMLREFSGYVEGMMFAILLGNICAPLFDEIGVALWLRRFSRAG